MFVSCITGPENVSLLQGRNLIAFPLTIGGKEAELPTDYVDQL